MQRQAGDHGRRIRTGRARVAMRARRSQGWRAFNIRARCGELGCSPRRAERMRHRGMSSVAARAQSRANPMHTSSAARLRGAGRARVGGDDGASRGPLLDARRRRRFGEHRDEDANAPRTRRWRRVGPSRDCRDEVARSIVRQQPVLDEILMAIMAGGHALLVACPAPKRHDPVNSRAMRLEFGASVHPDSSRRHHGTEIRRRTADPCAQFPSFTADSQHRLAAGQPNTASTQAALIEARKEHSVTASGNTRHYQSVFVLRRRTRSAGGKYQLTEAQ